MSVLTSPLAVYPRQLPRTTEFQQAKATAVRHREAIIAYSAARRVLESVEYGVVLTSKQYYNTVEGLPTKRMVATIVGLLAELGERRGYTQNPGRTCVQPYE